jgi:hypothetical protein
MAIGEAKKAFACQRMDCSEEVAAIRRVSVSRERTCVFSVDRIRSEQLRLSERDLPSAHFA